MGSGRVGKFPKFQLVFQYQGLHPLLYSSNKSSNLLTWHLATWLGWLDLTRQAALSKGKYMGFSTASEKRAGFSGRVGDFLDSNTKVYIHYSTAEDLSDNCTARRRTRPGPATIHSAQPAAECRWKRPVKGIQQPPTKSAVL